ncbi:MAG: ABC transporter permease [Actinobacteria bacterium]|nr:ABC transporter permease [Actinomycetota bacterium]
MTTTLATRTRPYAAQVRAELTLSLRQGEQLLVSVGIPLLLLTFFSLVDVLPKPAGVEQPVDFLAPGILALAIMSTAMVSLGIGTGFERQYKVLKRLGSTPLGRPRLIAAKITMVLAIEAAQVVVISAVAVALGWRPGGPILLVAPAVVFGTAAFAGIGLLLAGTLKGTVNLALCNGLYLVLLLLGGMIIPLEQLPTGIEALAKLLPAAALAQVMDASVTGGSAFPAFAWAVLVVWAISAPIAAAASFRWE